MVKSFSIVHNDIPDIEVYLSSLKGDYIVLDRITNEFDFSLLEDVDYLGIVWENNNNYMVFFDPYNYINEQLYFLNNLVLVNPNITIDFITCYVSHTDAINLINYYSNQFNIDIRYSLDLTGNPDNGGNWIMESHDVDITDIYFNSNIIEYHHILGQGASHNGFVDINKNVYMWGLNNSGQLGLNNTINVNKPTLLSRENFEPELYNEEYIVKIECGNNTTGFLSNLGRVFICGNNTDGRTGLNITSKNTLKPTLIKEFNPEINNEIYVKDIVLGSSSGLLLLSNNDLYSFGRNSNGQTGLNSSNGNTLIPTKITLFEPELQNIYPLEIYCGASHSGIIMSDNSLYTFGDNRNGRTSQGMSGGNTLIPTKIELEENIKNISCGSSHMCVLTKEKIFMCGNNQNGRTGLGRSSGNNNRLVELEGLNEKIIKVSCGSTHTLFLSEKNNLYICGSNATGQTGLNTINGNTESPVLIDSNVIDILGCASHSLILKENNEIYTCGTNDNGRTGLSLNSGNTLILTKIENIEKVDIICNSKNNLYLINKEESEKKIKTLMIIHEDLPDKNKFIEGVKGEYIVISRIDNNFDYNLLIDIDYLGLVWENNNSFMPFFDPYNYFQEQMIFAHNLVKMSPNVIVDFITSYVGHTDVENLVNYFMFHFNILIRYSTNITGSPNIGGDWIMETTGDNVYDIYFNENINDYPHIFGEGSAHNGFIDQNGDLYMWGLNNVGQLGLGDIINRLEPTLVSFDLFSPKLLRNERLDKIFCGSDSTAIITNRGRLYTFGNNANGKTGHNTNKGIINYPKQVERLNNKRNFRVENVCIGKSSMGIILNTGEVYVCGDNHRGNIGLGLSSGDTLLLTKINNFNPSLKRNEKIKKIYLGFNHSFFITSENRIYSCGNNTNGRTGLNLDSGNTLIPTQLNLFEPELKKNIDIVNISCGSSHSIILLSNGDIYSCGSNLNARTGLNKTTGQTLIPTKITSFNPNLLEEEKIIQISTGSTHCGLITNLGNIYTFGSNNSGQTGMNTDSNNTTIPTKINIEEKCYQVSCCASHTNVLTINGDIYSCGSNESGRTGLGINEGNSLVLKKVVLNKIGLYLFDVDNKLFSNQKKEEINININNPILKPNGEVFTKATGLRVSNSILTRNNQIETEKDIQKWIDNIEPYNLTKETLIIEDKFNRELRDGEIVKGISPNDSVIIYDNVIDLTTTKIYNILYKNVHYIVDVVFVGGSGGFEIMNSNLNNGGSIEFSGTSNSNLLIENDEDLRMRTSDFTVEWFQYQTDNNSFPRIFSIGTYPNTSFGVSIESNTFYLWMNNSPYAMGTLSNYKNTWVYFSITRDGSSVKVYRDGILLGTTSFSGDINGSDNLRIGNETTTSSSASYGGLITNLRWVKGSVLYTTDYDIPESPLTNITNTKLLLLASNENDMVIDSGMDKIITNNNTIWNINNPFPEVEQVLDDPTENPKVLMVIDSQLPDLEILVDSLKREYVDYVILNRLDDSFDVNMLINKTHMGLLWLNNNNHIPFFDPYEYFNEINSLVSRIVQVNTNLIVDFLTCHLEHTDVENLINYFMFNYPITIRYSVNSKFDYESGGEWVLTSNNINVKNLYFNENINNYNNFLTDGVSHNIVIDQKNDIYVWGLNRKGQLGLNDYENRLEPTLLNKNLFNPMLLDDEIITKTICGTCTSACITNKGRLYTWGNNLYSGNGLNIFRGETKVPTLVKEFNPVVEKGVGVVDISLGVGNGIILLSNGDVYTFGINTRGMTGLNKERFITMIPTKITSFEPELNIGVVVKKISMGSRHTLLLMSDNSLYTFGCNEHGRNGLDSLEGHTIKPNKIDIFNPVIPEGVEIKDIRTANNNSILLLSNNDIYVSGSNMNGRIGRNTISGQITTFTKLEVYDPELGENEDIISITLGTTFGGFVTSLGNVYTFGSNSNGQTCQNTTYSNTIIPTKISGYTPELGTIKPVMVNCSLSHTNILMDDGSIYTSGNNASGRTGLGIHILDTIIPTKIEIGNIYHMNNTRYNLYGGIEIESNIVELGSIIKFSDGSDFITASSINVIDSLTDNSGVLVQDWINNNNVLNLSDISDNYIPTNKKEYFVSSGESIMILGVEIDLMNTRKYNIRYNEKDYSIKILFSGGSGGGEIIENSIDEELILGTEYKTFTIVHNEIPDLNIFTNSLKDDYIVLGSIDLSFNYNDLSDVEYLGIVWKNDFEGLPLFDISNNYFSNDFENFILNIKQVNPEIIIDLITCYLESDDIIERIEEIKDNTGIVIRYSIDLTGNPESGGNWIMESDNIDIKNLYFNENIESYNQILGYGGIHTFIIDQLGRLFCWGLNSNGQLGNNSTTDIDSPTELDVSFFNPNLEFGETVVYVAVGNRNTAFVTSRNKLYMCGSNDFGLNGNGLDSGNLLVPTQITIFNPPIRSGYTIKEVALGDNSCSLVTSVNDVYSWGRNANGRNGLGLSTGTNTLYPTRVTQFDPPLGFLVGVKNVALGQLHGLFLTTEGEVYVFGSNSNGRTGLNITSGNTIIPTKLNLNFSVKRINVGLRSSAFISEDGEVYTFGNNDNGRTGLGLTNGDTLVPTKITVFDPSITSEMKVKQIFSGFSHTLVVFDSGEIYAFGQNSSGRTGLGRGGGNTSIPEEISRTSFNPSLEDGVIPVSTTAGFAHSIVLLSNGDLYSFGSNQNGRTGLGRTSGNTTRPERFSQLDAKFLSSTFTFILKDVDLPVEDVSLSSVIKFPDGTDFIISSQIFITSEPSPTAQNLLTNGNEVQDWINGVGNFVKGGHAINISNINNWTPFIENSESIKFVSLGSSTTIFDTVIDLESTRLYNIEFGGKKYIIRTLFYGGSGGGDCENLEGPNGKVFTIVNDKIPDLTIFTDSLRGDFIVTDEIDLNTFDYSDLSDVDYLGLVWKNNFDGIPFFDSSENYFNVDFENFLVELEIVNSNIIVDLITCYIDEEQADYLDNLSSTIGIDIRYSLDLTGNPNSGGNWVMENTGEDITEIYFNNNIINYAHVLGAGSTHNGYSDQNGDLWMWGSNGNGQLGLNDTTNRLVPTFVPRSNFTPPMKNDEKIKSIACCDNYTLLVTTRGRIYTMGANNNGRNGLLLTTGNTLVPTYVFRYTPKIPRDAFIVQGAAAGNVSMIVLSNGDLYSCGANSNGMTGLGLTSGNTLNPTKITVFSPPLGEGDGIKQAYVGADHVIAVTWNGLVYTWGRNANGRTGLNTTQGNELNPTLVTGYSPALESGEVIDSIIAGASHSAMVTSLGRLYICGTNQNGRTGLNITQGNTIVPTLVTGYSPALGSGEIIEQVSAGAAHTTVVTSNKVIYSFGNNGNGRTGLNTAQGNTLVPTLVTDYSPVLGGNNIVKTSACVAHTVSVLDNGHLYACGDNNSGRTGLNTAQGNTLIFTRISEIQVFYLFDSFEFLYFNMTRPNTTITLNNTLLYAEGGVFINNPSLIITTDTTPTTFNNNGLTNEEEVQEWINGDAPYSDYGPAVNITGISGSYEPILVNGDIQKFVSEGSSKTIFGVVVNLDSTIVYNTLYENEYYTIRMLFYGGSGGGEIQNNEPYFPIPCLTDECYLLTKNGYRHISKFKEGDNIITEEGIEKSIKRIVIEEVNSKENPPYLIRRNKYGVGVPFRDTLISMNHAYKKEDKWILPKFDFLEAIRYKSNRIRYYKILMNNYFEDNLMVNGMVMESWDGLGPNDVRPYKWVVRPWGLVRKEIKVSRRR